MDSSGRSDTLRARFGVIYRRHPLVTFGVLLIGMKLFFVLLGALEPPARGLHLRHLTWVDRAFEYAPLVLCFVAYAIAQQLLTLPPRALALMGANRLDQAESLLARVAARPLVPARTRALAHLNLAAIAQRRGQFQPMYREVRLGRALLGGRGIYASLATLKEVDALVALDLADDAAKLLDSVAEPSTDHLRLQWATSRLAIEFRRGRLDSDEARLASWSELALRAGTGGILCALLAWAQSARGDEHASARLTAAAREKVKAMPFFAHAYPQLDEWLRSRG